MNWFTKSFVKLQSDDKKRALVAEWGGCDHVEADPLLLHTVSYENDSFGREGHCLCEECVLKLREEEDEKSVICKDCHGVFKKKDTIDWKWYDFMVSQGDKPITVCTDCQSKPKHLERVKRDRDDYFNEFPQHEDYDH